MTGPRGSPVHYRRAGFLLPLLISSSTCRVFQHECRENQQLTPLSGEVSSLPYTGTLRVIDGRTSMRIDISRVLRHLRRTHGDETHSEAADRIGVSVHTYRSWARVDGACPDLRMWSGSPLCCHLATCYGMASCDAIRCMIGVLPHRAKSLRLVDSYRLAALLSLVISPAGGLDYPQPPATGPVLFDPDPDQGRLPESLVG